jgi:probable HAF family extracellular repeat protein
LARRAICPSGKCPEGDPQITTLNNPLATGTTSAYGINDAGQIVGSYVDGTGIHGFVYSNGSYSTINNPLNPNNTVLYGINNAGQVVGQYGGANGIMQGFLYSNGTFTTLQDPASPNFTQANGISNGGLITGNINISQGPGFGGTGFGFVYNSGSYTTSAILIPRASAAARLPTASIVQVKLSDMPSRSLSLFRPPFRASFMTMVATVP